MGSSVVSAPQHLIQPHHHGENEDCQGEGPKKHQEAHDQGGNEKATQRAKTGWAEGETNRWWQALQEASHDGDADQVHGTRWGDS